MCGLAGYFGNDLQDARSALTRAARAIAHRGPDDEGYWEDRDAGIHLAHRRLSILDLSPAGHQPMPSADGRLVIAYNGEIYNHLKLRERLEREGSAPPWRGHSDTETLLACVSAWGIEKTLESLIGMFAFALWDRETRQLTLARDRLGEKPLYYGWVGNGIGFASELKALRELPGFSSTIDRAALASLMSFNAVAGTRSIYEGVSKLAPGHVLTLSREAVAARRLPAPTHWWKLADVARRGLTDPLHFDSDDAATDALESVLREAVASQMIADVPIGAFLSGGIDSSTTVALMQTLSTEPVKTFTIGFGEAQYDESAHAKAVAEHLGTEHHELHVDADTARKVIPLLPDMFCEPFADASQIPTWLVSRLAREHVTVSLSGDAGDELFGGYARYFNTARIWARLQHLPRPLGGPIASAIKAVPIEAWDRVAASLRPVLPSRYRFDLPGHKAHRVADLLDMPDFVSLYGKGMITQWRPGLVLGDTDGGIPPMLTPPEGLPPFEQMMLQDCHAYLTDDILVKVDRAAMAVSLETRIPMLDVRVVDFAWRLPIDYKVRGTEGKWLLKQVLARHVPPAMFERPKMGFGVPIDIWLRGPLRDWAEHLLDEQRLREAGLFDPEPIRRLWAEHLSERRNWQYHLWPVLMFEAWRDRNS